MLSARLRFDPGMTVGPYVVERRLREGGMSVLFLAYDPRLRRPVVLKVVHDDVDAASTRARLLREARALAAVDHPGVVRVYGTGEHNGANFIAVEYVAGCDLKRTIADTGVFSPERALRVVLQAAEALAAAHEAGVIHRDIKPSNILLTDGDKVKLVDFGIARRRYDAGDVQTGRMEISGTTAYLAPEQLEHGLSDERSDIWALGCVLYELVAGGPPFGRASGPSTMAAILRDEPVYPAALQGPVEQVVSWCLKKNSFQRIASPRELISMIRDALGDVIAFSHRPSEGPRSSRTPRPSVASQPVQLRSSRFPASIPAASIPPGSSVRTSSGLHRIQPALGRVKGAAIRPGLTWFRSKYGDAGLLRVVDRSSLALQEILQKGDPALGMIASGWYDAELVAELIERLYAEATPDDLDTFLEILSEAIARDNVSGVYRALFRLIATPELLEANAQRVWRTYSDDGTFDVSVRGAGELTATLKACPTHRPTICRLVAPLLQSMLREVGFTAMVVERTQCVAEGFPHCSYEGVWLPALR